MRFDLTITLGNIVQLATILGALFVGYGKIRDRLVRIETQVEPLWGQFVERRRRTGTIGTTE